jgi:hypothetical protein
MQSLTISQLIAARIAAKRAEDHAIQARRDVDAQIADYLRDATKPEGSVSQKTEDGYKVTCTYKVDRKVDTDALQKAWDKLTADQQSAFKWSASVSVTGLRKLDDKAQVAVGKLITAKPATPSITIEAV